MTKKEIALTLAKQYVGIEKEFHNMMGQVEYAKTTYGRGSDEYRWSVQQKRKFYSNMETIEQSKNLLGLSQKTWYDALTAAYIENSKAEKAI